MSEAKTWLLPDGIADILPVHASLREQMRRHCIDTMQDNGYALVEPPLVEYTESLLNCANEALKRQTFRVVDQLTGRLMGVRADITHQVARIDAHVLPTENVARYCYAAPVLHTKPKTTFASRTPMQVGAEIYGHAGISADIEAIDTLMAMLSSINVYQKVGKQQLHISFGNVAIFKNLAQIASISQQAQTELLSLYERKALPELKEYCSSLEVQNIDALDFYVLAKHSQDIDTLLANLSIKSQQTQAIRYAVYDLKRMQAHFKEKWPNCHASVDAAELSSYHYHTGCIFSLYAEYELTDIPQNKMENVLLLGQGGRYDGIGKNFGRNRNATGFSCDLDTIMQFKIASGLTNTHDGRMRIAAPALQNDEVLQKLISEYKQQGHVIINKLSKTDGDSATHEIMIVEKQWQLVALS